MNHSPIQIFHVIRPDTVLLDLPAQTRKDELLERLALLLLQAGKISSLDEYMKAVYEREALGPTYMENFIAIPHGKSPAVIQAGIAFARSHEGIAYETVWGGGVAKLIFLLAIPESMAPDQYVAVLAHLARLLVHDEFRDALYAARNYQDVHKAIYTGERWLEKEEA